VVGSYCLPKFVEPTAELLVHVLLGRGEEKYERDYQNDDEVPVLLA
jgi:hypothetical protein